MSSSWRAQPQLKTVKELFPQRPHTRPLVDLVAALERAGVAPGSILRGRGRPLARCLGRMPWLTRTFIERGYRIVPLMWPSAARLFPYVWTNRIVPYCFDVWPRDYEQWSHLLTRLQPPVAFVTARQSSEALAERTGLDVRWAPEAIDPEPLMRGRAYVAKRIDVLAYGRLGANGFPGLSTELRRVGLFPDLGDGTRRFATLSDVYDAIASSRACLVAPRSFTHPEQAANVETMTLRYLECIVLGSLPVGVAPAEMIDLFGFSPVLQVDFGDARSAALILNAIINDPDTLDQWTARNRQRLSEVATCDVRAREVIARVHEAVG